MKLSPSKFCAYIFRIVICSWFTLPLIRMKNPSLSLLINFSLKAILYDFKIARPVCFLIFYLVYFCLFFDPTVVVPIYKDKQDMLVSFFHSVICYLQTTGRWILFSLSVSVNQKIETISIKVFIKLSVQFGYHVFSLYFWSCVISGTIYFNNCVFVFLSTVCLPCLFLSQA